MSDAEDSREPEHRSARSGRALGIRIAKWLIAVVVAIGLYLAAKSAVTQWELESNKLRIRIVEVDREMMATADASKQAELRQQKANLEASVPRWENLRWDRMGLAAVLYAIGLVPPAFLLRRALYSLGQRPRIGTTIAAQLLGHVGKYVPGKAMVIVLRAGALAQDDVRPLAATISVFLETFLMMAVGAAVAGLVVLWLPVPTWITVTALCVAVLASLPTLPPILKRIAARASKISIMETDASIDMGLFAAGWGWSLLAWIFVGASFTVLVSAIPSAQPLPPWIELYAIATAAISLAMVIGFASLLPGGAGVRELVLSTVLGVAIGSAHGLLAAIAARIMFIVVEAILAGGSWLWLRRK